MLKDFCGWIFMNHVMMLCLFVVCPFAFFWILLQRSRGFYRIQELALRKKKEHHFAIGNLPDRWMKAEASPSRAAAVLQHFQRLFGIFEGNNGAISGIAPYHFQTWVRFRLFQCAIARKWTLSCVSPCYVAFLG